MSHPILRGVNDVWVQAGGYVGKPVDAEILTIAQPLNGMTPDSPADDSKPPMPSEWTRHYKSASGQDARFFTSLYGASEDILNAGYRRMIVNGCLWAMGLEESITSDLTIDFVGPYEPNTFGSGSHARGIKPEMYAGYASPIPATHDTRPSSGTAQASGKKKQEKSAAEQEKSTETKEGTVDPNLPNVLIIGDSISIRYTPLVRDGLNRKANVMRPKSNCSDTRAGLANIDKWLGSTKWDVIHFNWGLHDLCYRNSTSKESGKRDKISGTLSVSLTDYEKNLDTLVVRLKETGARLIWASTTLVPENEPGRFAGDEVKYNAVAERVMKKHGVMMNDLHAKSQEMASDMFRKAGDVHFTAERSLSLASEVVAKVTEVLPTQP